MEEERDLGRIVAFSDGVMAVAITLLVLNLEVPDVSGEDLGDALVDLVPSLGSYALAFALIGRYWAIHHNLFEKLRAFDGLLMALNLLFLASIALVPFSTELYDRYTDEGLAAAVFSATLAIAGLTNWAMSAHVARRRFLRAEHRDTIGPWGSSVGLGIACVFLLSVPAAFLNVHLAEALWVLAIVVRYPLRRLEGRITSA